MHLLVKTLRIHYSFIDIILVHLERKHVITQFARKLHLIGNFHKLAQIYFIVLLKTPPIYKDVDPPPGLNNKRVL